MLNHDPKRRPTAREARLTYKKSLETGKIASRNISEDQNIIPNYEDLDDLDDSDYPRDTSAVSGYSDRAMEID